MCVRNRSRFRRLPAWGLYIARIKFSGQERVLAPFSPGCDGIIPDGTCNCAHRLIDALPASVERIFRRQGYAHEQMFLRRVHVRCTSPTGQMALPVVVLLIGGGRARSPARDRVRRPDGDLSAVEVPRLALRQLPGLEIPPRSRRFCELSSSFGLSKVGHVYPLSTTCLLIRDCARSRISFLVHALGPACSPSPASWSSQYANAVSSVNRLRVDSDC